MQNSVDCRTFAVAASPIAGQGSVVFRTLRNDQYTLAETCVNGPDVPNFTAPRLITRVQGEQSEGPILAGQNLTLCYNPWVDNQRLLFFSDEDAADGYIYMRTSGEPVNNKIVNWSFPRRIFVNGKGFKAHRDSGFAAVFRSNPDMLFLHCIDENYHLVQLQGTINEDNLISWVSNVSTYICAPRGDLAATQVPNQTCIVYRNQNLDLCLARIAQLQVGGPFIWQDPITVREAELIARDSALAIALVPPQNTVTVAFVKRVGNNMEYASVNINVPEDMGNIVVPDDDRAGRVTRPDTQLGIYQNGAVEFIVYSDSSNAINALQRGTVFADPAEPTVTTTILTGVVLPPPQAV